MDLDPRIRIDFEDLNAMALMAKNQGGEDFNGGNTFSRMIEVADEFKAAGMEPFAMHNQRTGDIFVTTWEHMYANRIN